MVKTILAVALTAAFLAAPALADGMDHYLLITGWSADTMAVIDRYPTYEACEHVLETEFKGVNMADCVYSRDGTWPPKR